MAEIEDEKKAGRVSFYDSIKEFGFVKVMAPREEGSKRRGIEVWVGRNVLKGRKLVEGERVEVSFSDEGHKSGRVVATAIEGPGVASEGQETGWVSAWDSHKGYGFIRSKEGHDIFIHIKELGELYMLKIGAKVYYDAVDKGHERGQDAVNVSGPGMVLKTESLETFFYDLGIEMDDELYATLETESILTTDDLLRCTYNDLLDLGFGKDATVRIVDTAFKFKNFPHPKPEKPRNDLAPGEVRGRVVTWKPSLGWGMVVTKNNDKIYIPKEAIKGGSLMHGEMIIVTPKDVEHSSGRLAAESVRGYGYKPQGKYVGEVFKWNENGMFGFIRECETAEESFVSFAATPELALRVGKLVTYDRDDKGGAKTTADNISGEGLCLATDLQNDALGGAYGDFFRNTELGAWGQFALPMVQGRTLGGKGFGR